MVLWEVRFAPAIPDGGPVCTLVVSVVATRCSANASSLPQTDRWKGQQPREMVPVVAPITIAYDSCTDGARMLRVLPLEIGHCAGGIVSKK